MRLNRARIRRVASDVLAGSVLGGLAFLAARALGLPIIFGLLGFEALLPFIVLGGVLYLTPLRPLVWTFAGLLLLVLVVGALTPAVVHPARWFMRADRATARVDAVAVLSSGVNDDELVSPDGVDRLLSGIALARSQRSEQHPNGVPIVLTVVTRGRSPVRSSAPDQQRIVELAGGGIDAHWTAPVHSTRDEARAVSALARTEGWERVAVVTSPMHTRRACATAERVGLTIRCVPADARDYAATALRSSRDRIRATQLLFYEIAGTAYYKVRGWI